MVMDVRPNIDLTKIYWGKLCWRPVIVFVTIALFSPIFSPIVSADQHDPKLDGLFTALQTSLSPAKAANYEREIWARWTKFPDNSLINGQMENGIFLMNAGRLDEAEAAFSTIIAHQPSFAEAWNKRATVRFFRGNDDGSARDILQVITLEPRHFGALSGLGMIRVRAGDLQGGLQAYRAAQRLNPHLPNIETIINRLAKQLNGRAL